MPRPSPTPKKSAVFVDLGVSLGAELEVLMAEVSVDVLLPGDVVNAVLEAVVPAEDEDERPATPPITFPTGTENMLAVLLQQVSPASIQQRLCDRSAAPTQVVR